MTKATRATLQNWAEGMQMPWGKVVREYRRLDQTKKGSALTAMRELERLWQERASMTRWQRIVDRWLSPLRRWWHATTAR